jgi:hypothetical protein
LRAKNDLTEVDAKHVEEAFKAVGDASCVIPTRVFHSNFREQVADGSASVEGTFA